MQHYEVLKSFNVFVTGDTVELDPESNDTEVLLRDGYIAPAGDSDDDHDADADPKTPDE